MERPRIRTINTQKCNHYTVPELKEMAKKRGITGYSKLRKEELCQLLNLPYIKYKKTPSQPKISRNELIIFYENSLPKKCNRVYPVFPCYYKYAIFANKREWDEFQKLLPPRTKDDRLERAAKANEELRLYKESAKTSTPVKKASKVRFTL